MPAPIGGATATKQKNDRCEAIRCRSYLASMGCALLRPLYRAMTATLGEPRKSVEIAFELGVRSL